MVIDTLGTWQAMHAKLDSWRHQAVKVCQIDSFNGLMDNKDLKYLLTDAGRRSRWKPYANKLVLEAHSNGLARAVQLCGRDTNHIVAAAGIWSTVLRQEAWKILFRSQNPKEWVIDGKCRRISLHMLHVKSFWGCAR